MSAAPLVAVVLAAGRASRFGSAKLLAALDGIPLIERALTAAAAYPTIVVASPEVAAYLGNRWPDVTVVPNAAPERGMAHSLRLADAQAPAGAALIVLLADMPGVDATVVRRVAAAYACGVDVVAPRVGTRPAHPVIFGPRPRTALVELPDGDSLRQVRASPYYRRVEPELGDPQVLRDIDVPADLEEAP